MAIICSLDCQWLGKYLIWMHNFFTVGTQFTEHLLYFGTEWYCCMLKVFFKIACFPLTFIESLNFKKLALSGLYLAFTFKCNAVMQMSGERSFICNTVHSSLSKEQSCLVSHEYTWGCTFVQIDQRNAGARCIMYFILFSNTANFSEGLIQGWELIHTWRYRSNANCKLCTL